MGLLGWVDNKLSSFQAKNKEIYDRYVNAPDRELVQYFKVHKKNNDIFNSKFLVIAKILQERGIIDEHMNLID